MRSRYLAPVIVGVVVFGAVTAFAASMTVSSSSLGAGNVAVDKCNDTAAVSYNTALSAGVYKVTTAPVATAATCAGMAYRVALTGAGNVVLGEVTGNLDSVTGDATPDFTSAGVAAAAVTGVSVVVTG
jgi:hypothetical protein